MDAYCTIQELADALRITVTASNTPALTACCEAAAVEIDDAIDSELPPDYTIPASPLVNRVNVLRAVEWWKANDAAFGVVGFDQIGAVRAPRNAFARHRLMLLPVKQRWGVA